MRTDKRNRALEDQLLKLAGKFLLIVGAKFQVHKVRVSNRHRNLEFYAHLEKN